MKFNSSLIRAFRNIFLTLLLLLPGAIIALKDKEMNAHYHPLDYNDLPPSDSKQQHGTSFDSDKQAMYEQLHKEYMQQQGYNQPLIDLPPLEFPQPSETSFVSRSLLEEIKNSIPERDGQTTSKEMSPVHKGNEASCYQKALSYIGGLSCADLTDKQHYKLALLLTVCHLQLSARPQLDCDYTLLYTQEQHNPGSDTYSDASEHAEEDAASTTDQCLKKLNDHQFQVYTEMYTHIPSLCYFIRSRQFREHIEQSINKMDEALYDSYQVLKDVKANGDMLQQDLQKSSYYGTIIQDKLKSLGPVLMTIREDMFNQWTRMDKDTDILNQKQDKLHKIVEELALDIQNANKAAESFKTHLNHAVLIFTFLILAILLPIKQVLFIGSLGSVIFFVTSFIVTTMISKNMDAVYSSSSALRFAVNAYSFLWGHRIDPSSIFRFFLLWVVIALIRKLNRHWRYGDGVVDMYRGPKHEGHNDQDAREKWYLIKKIDRLKTANRSEQQINKINGRHLGYSRTGSSTSGSLTISSRTTKPKTENE